MTNQQRNAALKALLMAAQYLTEGCEVWAEHSDKMAVSAIQAALSHLGISHISADESVYRVLERIEIETPDP